MSYTKRFFEIMRELIKETPEGISFTGDQTITICGIILSEENKDKRSNIINQEKKFTPITEPQIKFLRDCGYENVDGMTKQEASKKIGELIEQKRNKK